MRYAFSPVLAVAFGINAANAHTPPPLLPEKTVAALSNELSGETAQRNLEGLARFHRQRGSQGFHAAAELIAERARAYGLSNVQILKFPTDGKTFYGTQRSREAWDADEGELWDVKDGGEVKLASYAAEPVVLAEDSESGEATAELIDVGTGTHESDYAGKDIQGKIILISTSPGAAQDLAVGKFHAAGIVSYAQNQGSDHQIYEDSSFGIPAIYLNDWPDRYIHTNFDTAANIDPTKLERAAFIGAASGYFLAGFSSRDIPAVPGRVGLGRRVFI